MMPSEANEEWEGFQYWRVHWLVEMWGCHVLLHVKFAKTRELKSGEVGVPRLGG